MSSTAVTPERLSLVDRCDQCGAQAYVRVTLTAGTLLFCGHHFHRHADLLRPQALSIEDFTGDLSTPTGS